MGTYGRYRPVADARIVCRLPKAQAVTALNEIKPMVSEDAEYEHAMRECYESLADKKEKAESIRNALSAEATTRIVVISLVTWIVAGILIGMSMHDSLYGLFWGFILSLVALIISIGAIGPKDRELHQAENDRKAEQYTFEHIRPLQIKLQEAKQKREALRNSGKWNWAVDAIGVGNLSVSRINGILNILHMNRAANITDAINVYEGDLHRERLEQLERERLNSQLRTEAAVIDNAQRQEAHREAERQRWQQEDWRREHRR